MGPRQACGVGGGVGWPRPLRTPALTVTLLVTAASRRSGGTSSSRAAVWISAQLDTAATSWDSRWTEKGGGGESSAVNGHSPQGGVEEAGPRFPGELRSCPNYIWWVGADSGAWGP